MTRSKKLVRAAAAVAGAAFAVLASNVHWKLYAWVRGEPFLEGVASIVLVGTNHGWGMADAQANVIGRATRARLSTAHLC
jgi:hypothetical protein